MYLISLFMNRGNMKLVDRCLNLKGRRVLVYDGIIMLFSRIFSSIPLLCAVSRNRSGISNAGRVAFLTMFFFLRSLPLGLRYFLHVTHSSFLRHSLYNHFFNAITLHGRHDQCSVSYSRLLSKVIRTQTHRGQVTRRQQHELTGGRTHSGRR